MTAYIVAISRNNKLSSSFFLKKASLGSGNGRIPSGDGINRGESVYSQLESELDEGRLSH